MDVFCRRIKLSIVVALSLVVCISCNEESGCEKVIREIDFLELYSQYNEHESFNLSEVENSIGFLEEMSGIQGSDGGNTICKCFITTEDVEQWRKWAEKECDCL